MQRRNKLAEKIIPMVEAAKDKCDSCKTIASLSQYLVKRSQWIIGGDDRFTTAGAAVRPYNKQLCIMPPDTEVYSNTGGQSSRLLGKSAIASTTADKRRKKRPHN